MNPREELVAARDRLLAAAGCLATTRSREDVDALLDAVEEARDCVARAADGAQAWEDDPAWVTPVCRISAALDDGFWLLHGLLDLWARGDHDSVRTAMPGAMRALSVSLDGCLLRIVGVLQAVRHG